jgi:hypothetical protein
MGYHWWTGWGTIGGQDGLPLVDRMGCHWWTGWVAIGGQDGLPLVDRMGCHWWARWVTSLLGPDSHFVLGGWGLCGLPRTGSMVGLRGLARYRVPGSCACG